MKYMGSKRYMLRNGLGELIRRGAISADRVVDLCCGAGSVSWFAAENLDLPVLSVDLQAYAAIMARAVVERTLALDAKTLVADWLAPARESLLASSLWTGAELEAAEANDAASLVKRSRSMCAQPSPAGPIWSAYGGYYFSPAQALAFDYMIKHLPDSEPKRSVCQAAMIAAGSRCAAAPGHTAQPFQPTPTAQKFILAAWSKDPMAIAEGVLADLGPRKARRRGQAIVGDALEVAKDLKSTDLVVLDPPYSEVQYSRFYHVLETLAAGQCGPVEGRGRYPPITERPQSDFCKKRESKLALATLVFTLARVGATVVLTFPSGECSNGLSGKLVLEAVRCWFDAEERTVEGSFSTLGGNNSCRDSRKSSSELLLLLKPKSRFRSGHNVLAPSSTPLPTSSQSLGEPAGEQNSPLVMALNTGSSPIGEG